MNLIRCNCKSQVVEQENVFAKKWKINTKKQNKTKNKPYCTALITCSLGNDAAYENQEIDDKRIVVISNVEH